MVKLIPDVLAPEIKSPAEKRLFIEFRDHRTNKNMSFCILWEFQNIPIIFLVRLIS